VVAELARYIISHNYFPPKLKEMILLTIFKKGDATRLENYRGIMLTNALMTLAISLEAELLQRWVDERGFLPPLQAATRPGVQGRDITSFLSMITTWSTRNKISIDILKKDQQKGFDFLSLQCFYDAVKFYGVPAAIEDFDRASQHNVPCRILTAHGLTEPIIISGVNRQGDNRAIRFTLSLGMCRWYLQESAIRLQSTRRLDTSVIMSTQHIEDIHHTPLDKLEVRVTSLEMMDDSLIFGRSQAAVTALHGEQEQFQYCYGAVTAVGPDKTCLYRINCVGEDNLGTTTMRRVKVVQRDPLGKLGGHVGRHGDTNKNSTKFAEGKYRHPDGDVQYPLERYILVLTPHGTTQAPYHSSS
jgi:hypothetical protein